MLTLKQIIKCFEFESLYGGPEMKVPFDSCSHQYYVEKQYREYKDRQKQKYLESEKQREDDDKKGLSDYEK